MHVSISQLKWTHSNEELRRAKIDFEFVICLDENSDGNKLEGVVLDTFLKLKEEGVLAKHMKRMEERFSNRQCLIHDDLYSSAIMTNGDQIRVSDPL